MYYSFNRRFCPRKEKALNGDIRDRLAREHITQTEIAHQLGVSRTTFYKRIREPFTNEDRAAVNEAIDRIIAERALA